MISMRELAWAAGFLEGEGNFGFYSGSPIVQAVQCNRECLEHLVGLFGGRVESRKMTPMGRKPIFGWKVWSSRAISIMLTLYPMMSQVRQTQISTTVRKWRALRHMAGETHAAVHFSDAEVLSALRRVLQGEPIYAVAAGTGIPRSSLTNLATGRWRGYLLRQLEAEGLSAQGVVAQRSVSFKHLDDDTIMAAMRRACAGEPLSKIASNISVQHSTISIWMAGVNRPDLLERLKAEIPPEQWLYRRRKAPRSWSDEIVFVALHRIQAGASLMTTAREFDIDRNLLSACWRGLKRPHLLAQLRQEASLSKEEP